MEDDQLLQQLDKGDAPGTRRNIQTLQSRVSRKPSSLSLPRSDSTLLTAHWNPLDCYAATKVFLRMLRNVPQCIMELGSRDSRPHQV